MTDETLGSRSKGQVVLKGYNPNYIVERRINGSDIKPGHIVTNYGESVNEDVDLCGAGEPPLGVALEHVANDGLASIRDTPDIDTLYTDNAVVRVALCGSGMTVLCWLAGQTTTTAVYGGTKLVTAASGKCSLPTFSTTTDQLYADFNGFFGRSIEYDTGGSDAKVIAVII